MNSLREILNQIDMDDTLYNNASEKYQNIAELLCEKMHGANVYPQGSFAIGTTTKPYKNGKDDSYDIDLVLELERPKDNNGRKILNEAYAILKGDGKYSEKVELFDKCITIHYAEVNGVKFNLDIIPAVKEDEATKQELLKMGAEKKYISEAIAISSLEDRNGWYTAVPKGYKKWFDEVNLPYKQNIYKTIQRDKDGNLLYESIEEVPRYKLKTSLQSAIQLLKRARDIHYSKIKKEDKKPISAIITTIVAKVASRTGNYSIGLEDLLNEVLKEIELYSMYNEISEQEFRNLYGTKLDIIKENGKWLMINPVNPKDNLVDSWNEDKEKSELFFNWIKKLKVELKNLINSRKTYEYENIFGSEIVRKAFNLPEHANTKEGPKPYGDK